MRRNGGAGQGPVHRDTACWTARQSVSGRYIAGAPGTWGEAANRRRGKFEFRLLSRSCRSFRARPAPRFRTGWIRPSIVENTHGVPVRLASAEPTQTSEGYQTPGRCGGIGLGENSWDRWRTWQSDAGGTSHSTNQAPVAQAQGAGLRSPPDVAPTARTARRHHPAGAVHHPDTVRIRERQRIRARRRSPGDWICHMR